EWRNAIVVCVSPVVYVIGGRFLLAKNKTGGKKCQLPGAEMAPGDVDCCRSSVQSVGADRRVPRPNASGGDHFHHSWCPPNVNVTPLRMVNGTAGNPNTG